MATETLSPMAAALKAGLDTLDLDQEVVFQKYTRVVLPVDGYIFWQPSTTITVQGALHHAQEMVQNEDETFGLATCTFTTQQRVTDFDDLPIDTIFVATRANFRYAFSRQQGYFDAASTWHYQGQSIPPSFTSQLLDTPGAIDLTRAVTSNSLALWLALNSYRPVYGFTPRVTLYPAFLVDANLVPPYGEVYIDGPRALSAIPALDANSSSTQSVADRVRIVLYGLQSNESIDFLNAVIQYSRDTQNFGLMSMPTVVDDKRPLPELQAIAMKKTIDMNVSYVQSRVNTVAQELILSAVPTIIVNRP